MRLKVPTASKHRGEHDDLQPSARAETTTQRLENAVMVIASERISTAC